MAKDYQKEAERLRAELADARRENERLWAEIRRRNDRDAETRDRLKELLLDALGR